MYTRVTRFDDIVISNDSTQLTLGNVCMESGKARAQRSIVWTLIFLCFYKSTAWNAQVSLFFEHFFSSSHCMVRIYTNRAPKNRLQNRLKSFIFVWSIQNEFQDHYILVWIRKEQLSHTCICTKSFVFHVYILYCVCIYIFFLLMA